MISLALAREVIGSHVAAEVLPEPLVDQLADLAVAVLQIETLERRGRDHLDFPEVHVEAIRDLVARAYALGVRDALGSAT